MVCRLMAISSIHHTPIGQTNPFTIDQTDQVEGILQPLADPAQNFGINTHTHDIIEVMLDFHDFFHVFEHGRGFFYFGLADYTVPVHLST